MFTKPEIVDSVNPCAKPRAATEGRPYSTFRVPVKFATLHEKIIDFVLICSINEHTAQSISEVLHIDSLVTAQVMLNRDRVCAGAFKSKFSACVLVCGRSE